MRTANKRKSEGRPIWTILRRRVLYLLIPICILTPAAAYYARLLPRTYRAKALVGAESQLPGLPVVGARIDPAAVNAQEQLRAIRETLLVPDVLQTVVREFMLSSSPAAMPVNKWFPWSRDFTRISTYVHSYMDGILGSSNPASHVASAEPPDGPFQLQQQAVQNLNSSIQIQVESPTSFYLGYESGDPDLAVKVANRLAAIFVQRTTQIRTDIVHQEDSVLDGEVERARGQLTAAENDLKTYKDRVSKQVPERFASNVKQLEDLQQQIQSRNDKMTDAESRRASILEEMRALEQQGVLKQEPPPMSPAQLSLNEKRQRLAQLKTRYTPQYPEIIALQSEIRDLETSVSTSPAPAPVKQPSEAQVRYTALKSELSAIEPRLASYAKERDALIAQLPEYQRRIDSSPGYEATINEQTKDTALLRSRYEALFAKQQEQKLNQRTEKTSTVSTYKILEPAQTPSAPDSPHRARILLFGFLASMAAGIAGLVLAEQMDSTFESPEEVENVATLPVLTAIPRIPTRLPRRVTAVREGKSNRGRGETASREQFSPKQMHEFQRQRLPVLSDPQSIAGQQFGILARKIERRMREGDKQILVVASAMGEEGKSVTALNVSLALAESLPGRVVLADCDLRRPQIHSRLDLSAEPGFGNLLTDDVSDISSYITTIGNLDVIPGGWAPANTTALLGSMQTRWVLDRLRQRYDLIVLDSPPLIPVADSQLLVDVADAVLLVIRARRTRADLFQRAKENVDSAKLLGAVLNDVEYAGTPYAYAYRQYQKHYLGRS